MTKRSEVEEATNDTVIVAGTGRSGTTWLADIINFRDEYRVMFEPFHHQRVDAVSHFKSRQYLRDDNREIEYLEPVELILAGRVRSKWIDRFNGKVAPKKRLVKDIRVNLLLKWMRSNFLQMPMILLLRHPCAVAHSRVRLNWETPFEGFLSQPDLMDDYLEPFKDMIVDIDNGDNEFEKAILLWCIETYVPIKQFGEDDIQIVFYEHLCTEPIAELTKLFRFLKTQYDNTVERYIGRASSMATPESAVIKGQGLIDGWRESLNERQVQRAMEMVSVFGLDNIYSSGSLPNRDGVFT